jgi:hypothetical protein
MKTVVILNAPPGCGKDTIADMFVAKHGATKQEFKASLYEKTAEYFETDLKYLKHIATSRKYKDTLVSAFSSSVHSKGFGRTPRESLIHVSESVYKPKHGSDYFGKLAADKLVDGLNVFSDGGGWWDELSPVAKAADRIIVFKLVRTDFNFDNDSRDYYDASTMPKDLENVLHLKTLVLIEDKPELAVKRINELLATE